MALLALRKLSLAMAAEDVQGHVVEGTEVWCFVAWNSKLLDHTWHQKAV